MKCAIKSCNNKKEKNKNRSIGYHIFPTDEGRRDVWIRACQRENIDWKKERICSIHFDDNAFKKSTKKNKYNAFAIGAPHGKRYLQDDAIPTKFLPSDLAENNGFVCQNETKTTNTNDNLSFESNFQNEILLNTNCQNLSYEKQRNEDKHNVAVQSIVNTKNVLKTVTNLQKDIKEHDKCLMSNCLQDQKFIKKSNCSNIAANKWKEKYEQCKKEKEELERQFKKSAKTVEKILKNEEKCRKKYEKEVEASKKREINYEKNLEARNKKIKKLEDTINQHQNSLSKIFSPNQIKILFQNKKKTHWDAVDIAGAISLRAVSSKCYRYLRENLNYPLPGFSTLRTWAQKLELKEGILFNVLDIMEIKGKKMSSYDKICVLSADEFYLSNQMAIDKKDEQVIGPHTTCQFIMARGLFCKWKQPVYYKFDQPLTKEIIFEVVKALYNKGYRVVALTSDYGATNQALLTKLNIGYTCEDDTEADYNVKRKTYFDHPCNKDFRVYIFPDVPHMIKLARNHFLDQGFLYEGHYITKKCFELLLQLGAPSDLKCAFKLTNEHLNCYGTRRQKVKLATQLFSRTNAKAIECCGRKGVEGFEEWKQVVETVELFNDWFDLFNSKNKYNYQNPGNNAFGVNLEEQCITLTKMKNFITKMRVKGHKKMIPFQKGIALDCDSLLNFFNHLKETANDETISVEYLLTYRLNQDVLENTFSYFRKMGSTNDHPTALDIKYRLRWYILGKHSTDFFSIHANTDHTLKDSDESLVNNNDINSLFEIYPSIPQCSTPICEKHQKNLTTNTLEVEPDVEEPPLEPLMSYDYVVGLADDSDDKINSSTKNNIKECVVDNGIEVEEFTDSRSDLETPITQLQSSIEHSKTDVEHEVVMHNLLTEKMNSEESEGLIYQLL